MIPILALSAALVSGPQADLVITGAIIYTADPVRPRASALAVKDGKVLAVGEDVEAYLGPRTRKLDVKDATVIPGFIDSHAHMEGLGDSRQVLELRNTTSPEQVAEMVRRAARERKPGEWIRGRSWDQSLYPSKEFPSGDVLTAAAPANPVYLTRVDGHASWVNAKALEMADITAATEDPPGGKILRVANGAPTGILVDTAQGLASRKIPPPTAEQVKLRLERAAQECARYGITTVHDAGCGREELDGYRALIAAGKLPIRVYAMIGGEGGLWREYLKRGPEVGDRLVVRSIKLFADGAMGSRGALLYKPYSDDPGNTGLAMISEQDIARIAKEAAARGFQVNTHAIGDKANRMTLDAYAAALAPGNDKRFRVEHAQVVTPEDVGLFRKYGVVAAMQATHATTDMRWAEARLGPQRVKGAYAWRWFLSEGVHVSNGSDFPVEEVNPLLGFYAAVTRQDASGKPDGGWFPDQTMTREEALKSWTVEGAYAAFEEKTKGSLTPGKVADFVVLSRDIMRVPAKEILSTRVRMTVVGGEIVYSE